MTAVPHVIARKTPAQERSRETVQRILDAAARVLKERGYGGVSTNRIAAAAGISPGSLYQYFPNKDAILEAMVADYTRQLQDEVSTKLHQLFKSECRRSILVPAAVRIYVDSMLERPEILQIISGQLPGYSGADLIKPVEKLISEIIRGYMLAVPNPPADMDIDAATWIIVQLLGAPIRYVVERPPIAKDVFINEMARLVLAHPIALVFPGTPTEK
ncbi:putative HTH-type transcriptional regulator [Mycobacterium simulans]|nr:putative HTH-type transcriptional regulator [Mycobacterium simulans]